MSSPYLVQEDLEGEEEAPQQEGDHNLRECSEKERSAPTPPPTAGKTSIARNPALARQQELDRGMYVVLDLTSSDEGDSDPEQEKGVSRNVLDLKPGSLPEEKLTSFPRLPLRTTGKRVFENSGNHVVFRGKEKKLSDEVNGEDGGGDEILGDIQAKSYVDRVSRDLDAEIELLKGISYYRSVGGRCASNEMALGEFLDHFTGVDAPAEELTEAIKILEKRYTKISRNWEALELAKKIWGTGSDTNCSDYQEGLGVKVEQEQDESDTKMEEKAPSDPVDGQETEDTEGGRPRKNLEGGPGLQSQDDLSNFPYLASFLKSENSNWNVLTRLMGDATLKRGVGLMTSSTMEGLDQDCKKLQDLEVDVFMLRTSLIGKIVEFAQDAVESSSSSAQ